jgi:predicted small integral membrane protein
MDLSWMAWTQFTAIFFLAIAGLIALMIVWEVFSPGGAPRLGFLGLTTTRGDRLFVSLLLSAFLTLAWLGLVALPLWWTLPVCLLTSVLVFCFF